MSESEQRYKTLQSILVDAVQIQDASNYRGVTLAFAHMVKWMSDDAVSNHPVASDEMRRAVIRCMLYKCMQLAFDREPMEYADQFTAAYKLVKKMIVPKTHQEFKEKFPKIVLYPDDQFAYVASVLEFAHSRNMVDKLVNRLHYLNDWAGDRLKECRLWHDRDGKSFNFYWKLENGTTMDGGLIYHPAGSGGLNEGHIRIGDTDEDWTVHT